MGNAFQTEKKNPFDDVEASPFDKNETDCIALRYKEICAAKADKSDASISSPIAAPGFHPILIDLLTKKHNLDSLDLFIEFLGDAMRVNSSKTLEMFWNLISVENKESYGREHMLKFFQFMISLMDFNAKIAESNASAVNNNVAESLVRAVIKYDTNSASKDPSTVLNSNDSYDLLRRWVSNYGPCIPKVFETYLTEKCFPNEKNPSFFPFLRPKISVKSTLLPNGAADLIPLSLYCAELQGNWKILYSSSSDGISFNRMVHGIMGYDGPICFLIKPQGCKNSVFGAFTTGRWKEFNRFYGTSDAFLFTLQPDFKIMRSRDRSNGNYQWLNTKSYGMPHGMALGGSMDAFRLFITESFENCIAAESCLTFETGSLLPDAAARDNTESNLKAFSPLTKSNFEIDFLEVWACGGDQIIQQGLKALAKDREIRDENIQKARKVDKAQFFGNAFDQEFLLSGTFAHRAQAQDRGEDCSVFADPGAPKKI